jgi:hypothetical protein
MRGSINRVEFFNKPVWAFLGIGFLSLGAILRLYQLSTQLLIDDEWHAIHKLISSDWIDIATHFGFTDHCIPLTLYFKTLQALDILTEWNMRLPSIASGLALLIVAPYLLRTLIPWSTLTIYMGLLAISPVLVYLGRTARPYALTCLLSFCALLVFFFWQRSKERALVAWRPFIYLFCTGLAGYAHLLTLPFTLTPFLFYGWRPSLNLCLRRASPNDLNTLKQLGGLGIATIALLTICLSPPLFNDWHSLTSKAITDSVTWNSALATWHMLLGISSLGICLSLTALMIIGIRVFYSEQPEFMQYLGLIFLLGVSVILILKPNSIFWPPVLTRYVLPALPFCLLFIAIGLQTIISNYTPKEVRPLLIVGVTLILFVSGPVPGYMYTPNQMMGHLIFQFDYENRRNPYVQQYRDVPISDFYQQLSHSKPRSLLLIEMPWRQESYASAVPLYQRVHKQLFKAGLTDPLCGPVTWGEYQASIPGVHLSQYIHLSELLRGAYQDADYLIIRPKPMWRNNNPIETWPEMDQCLPSIRKKFGVPYFTDDEIIVYKLK